MAIKFQYNKTSLGDLGKQLKMRQKALPTIKSKESALRSEVKKAKDSAGDYRRRLDALKAEYDYMVSLGESLIVTSCASLMSNFRYRRSRVCVHPSCRT